MPELKLGHAREMGKIVQKSGNHTFAQLKLSTVTKKCQDLEI
jgi:hypothetical protein